MIYINMMLIAHRINYKKIETGMTECIIMEDNVVYNM